MIFTKDFFKGLFIVIGVLLVAIILATFAISSTDGNSMYPTLKDGDTLLINTTVEPKDGDIIILDTADMEGWENKSKQIVKRYYEEYSTDGYYVIGDNSERSYDSRMTGEFDKERLLGVVVCNLSQDGILDILKAIIDGILHVKIV